MANPFYTYSGNFIPGTLGRAEAIAAEYQAVQAGFALLAIQGVDSGAANAYVVTTNGAPTGAYADGQIVQFKALNAPTGASTINVNGIGAVSLLRFTGAATQSGDFGANQWITAFYNSSFLGFTIISPAVYTAATGTISGAAPTHKVGLTAAGGVSTAAAPIDVTFALDQSIAPIWTGVHSYAQQAAPSAPAAGKVSLFAIASAAASITQLAALDNFGGQILLGYEQHMVVYNNSGSTITAGNAVYISGQNAGTPTIALAKANSAATMPAVGITQYAISNNTYGEIHVFGLVTAATTGFTSGQAVYVSASSAGALTNVAPSGSNIPQQVGICVTVGASGLVQFSCAVPAPVPLGANPSASVGLSVVNGSALTFMRSDAAPALDQTISPTWTGAHTFSNAAPLNLSAAGAHVNFTDTSVTAQDINFFTSGAFELVSRTAGGNFNLYVGAVRLALSVAAAGNVTIAAPSSGTALTVAGESGGTDVIDATAVSAASTFTIAGWANPLAAGAWNIATRSTDPLFIGTSNATLTIAAAGSNVISLNTNSSTRLQVNGAGNVTVNAPSSGTALSVTGASAATVLSLTTVGAAFALVLNSSAGTITGIQFVQAGQTAASVYQGASASDLRLQTNSSDRLLVGINGNVTVNAPSSGVGLTVNGVSGTHSTQIADSAGALFDAGYLDTPLHDSSTAITLALSDRGKLIRQNTTGGVTIPANSVTSFPVGTTILIYNNTGSGITISINIDSLTWLPSGTTGTRTLANLSVATLYKLGSTSWLIWGFGIT